MPPILCQNEFWALIYLKKKKGVLYKVYAKQLVVGGHRDEQDGPFLVENAASEKTDLNTNNKRSNTVCAHYGLGGFPISES